jgi:hypothetical protein
VVESREYADCARRRGSSRGESLAEEEEVAISEIGSSMAVALGRQESLFTGETWFTSIGSVYRFE